MLTDAEIRSQAVSLIEMHLGSMTAKMYKDFYGKKSSNDVIVSVKELLSEVIGPEKAEKEIGEAITTN